MPTTATDTRSLPYRRGHCNTQRPENTQTRARNAAVRRVLADQRLTYGARSFYCLIDQHYGWRDGLVCPKLTTLVLRFGLCRRSCQRWIAQLRECGHLTTEPRNGRACRHHLAWAQPVASDSAAVSPLYPINASERITEPGAGSSEPEQATAAEPPDPPEQPAECAKCHGTGEREYVIRACLDSRGRAVPEKRWRGPCGCRE